MIKVCIFNVVVAVGVVVVVAVAAAATMFTMQSYHHGTATARVHLVHLMNIARVPSGRRPLDQANQLEPQIHLNCDSDADSNFSHHTYFSHRNLEQF